MKISETEIRKIRCHYGANGVIDCLTSYSPEEIIIKSYIVTDNPIAEQLARKYEKMLLLAKVRPDEYVRNRDQLHLDMAKFIHDYQLLRPWIEFSYLISHGLETNRIFHAYLSELMESWNYIIESKDEWILSGVTSENEPILIPNPYANIDIPLLKAHRQYERKMISQEELRKKMLELEGQIEGKLQDENMIDLAIFGSMLFINERTKQILPQKWFMHSSAHRELDLPRIWKDTNFYHEQLKKRKYMIDRKGVKIFLKNAGSFNELLIIEDVTQDKGIAMLFRLSTSTGSTIGYYNLKNNDFYTSFKNTPASFIHEKLENFVLEIYCDLVCGLEKDIKRAYALKEVDDINQIENYRSTQVYVQYNIYDPKTDKEELSGKRKGYKQKPHERRFALRKLREGQKASEEAIQRALEYGIELQEGYTFVQSYDVGGIKEVRKEIEKG